MRPSGNQIYVDVAPFFSKGKWYGPVGVHGSAVEPIQYHPSGNQGVFEAGGKYGDGSSDIL